MLNVGTSGMAQSIKDAVATQGYACVRDYKPGAESFLVAEALGKTITPWANRRVQQLIPSAVGAPNTYSGIYGLQQFPFHTDLAHWRFPPRYLLLRCIAGYADIPTQLVDGRALTKVITFDILTRAVFRPRRPREGAISLLRLCEPIEDDHLLRWDEVFLQPASRIGEIAARQIREQLNEIAFLSIPLVQAGDTLLIDNWRMLHARAPIPAAREDRKIERVYLEALH